MAGASAARWLWLNRPEAKIEGKLIVGGLTGTTYTPIGHIEMILSDIQKVKDEKSCLQFVQQWGFLGLERSMPIIHQRSDFIYGALDFEIYRRMEKNYPNLNNLTDEKYEEETDGIYKEVFDFFDKKHPGPKLTFEENEPISKILDFAEGIRQLSEIKSILKEFKDESTWASAIDNAEEWFRSPKPQWFNSELSRIQSKHKSMIDLNKAFKENGSFEAIEELELFLVFDSARQSFSRDSERGVWVSIKSANFVGDKSGEPILNFDGLFRFLEYMLLIESGYWPIRCADPKCRKIVFPLTDNRKYCYPRPGEKRSRCQNRHDSEVKRKRKSQKS